jgi:poly(A) polymerase
MGAQPTTIPHTESRDAAKSIVRTLRDRGHIAYFAGGCVRDELLGLVPTDYDVATDATPQRIGALFPRTAEVGASFGVMLVKIGRVVVEVATFRADGTYTDRRRPDSIRFSDPIEDARRRDFTVNALFLDPIATPTTGASPTATPAVIDHVGGVDDLKRRVLRAVGDPDARLAEDHLRALRAARLAAKLGFDIDASTASAIRRHARDLDGVSRERIGDEVRRMLAHPSRAHAAAWLRTLGLEGPILQGPAAPAAAPNTDNESRVRDPAAWFPTLAHIQPTDSMAVFPACLAAWLLDTGTVSITPPATTAGTAPTPPPPEGAPGRPAKPVAPYAAILAQVRGALCLSNDERDDLRDVLVLRGVLEDADTDTHSDWLQGSVAHQKRTAAHRLFETALAVVAARAPARAVAIRARVKELAATPSGVSPEPLVTGDVLIAAGLQPGPRFKRILDAVYDAQLEDKFSDVESGIALARRLAAG